MFRRFWQWWPQWLQYRTILPGKSLLFGSPSILKLQFWRYTYCWQPVHITRATALPVRYMAHVLVHLHIAQLGEPWLFRPASNLSRCAVLRCLHLLPVVKEDVVHVPVLRCRIFNCPRSAVAFSIWLSQNGTQVKMCSSLYTYTATFLKPSFSALWFLPKTRYLFRGLLARPPLHQGLEQGYVIT